MAGLVKLTCLVLACMIVAGPMTANAALTCNTVTTYLLPCFSYLTQGAPLTRPCCTSIGNLNGLARTTPDRQQACRCLQGSARNIGSRLNTGRASGLPKACGVNIPYKISDSTNCNTVK